MTSVIGLVEVVSKAKDPGKVDVPGVPYGEPPAGQFHAVGSLESKACAAFVNYADIVITCMNRSGDSILLRHTRRQWIARGSENVDRFWRGRTSP